MAADEPRFAESDVRYSRSGFEITPLSEARVEELASKLTVEEREILLKKGTEPAFCGTLTDNKQDGIYTCKLCGLPLFTSDKKFVSQSGWPSFYAPYDLDHIRYEQDLSFGMLRTEIMCNRCGGHLGHLFLDGPKPTGLRYCLNSASLDFHDKSAVMPVASRPVVSEVAYFGGGCFWGIEDRFQRVPGVISVISGYQGGHVESPTYREVCAGQTGHAEVVRVKFDPKVVSYDDLLVWFFRFHDPTQVNRQWPDTGTQYRSVIFAADEAQITRARAFIEKASQTERFADRPIATQVVEAGPFWPAESYHQDYHEHNGGVCHIHLDMAWDLKAPAPE